MTLTKIRQFPPPGARKPRPSPSPLRRENQRLKAAIRKIGIEVIRHREELGVPLAPALEQAVREGLELLVEFK